jgi:hypothetical protein
MHAKPSRPKKSAAARARKTAARRRREERRRQEEIANAIMRRTLEKRYGWIDRS